ncbi:MAG TPA: hypothetical protein PLX05_06725 [Acinetobacter parvus]|uniref:hypothetical protein n=1 Tax=Acinetobacter parvus TaxID=134533 RepID=UPI002C28B6DC|nr:hypothetical protein [Acinetobacter parvus]HRM15316.1 hypothetical protein [Acinetobacter parvus]
MLFGIIFLIFLVPILIFSAVSGVGIVATIINMFFSSIKNTIHDILAFFRIVKKRTWIDAKGNIIPANMEYNKDGKLVKSYSNWDNYYRTIIFLIIIGFGIYDVTQPYIKRYNQRKEAKELYFANQVCEHYIRYKYKREIKELPPEIIKKEDINNEAHNECYYSLTPSRKEIFLEMKTELEQQGILSYKGGREY